MEVYFDVSTIMIFRIEVFHFAESRQIIKFFHELDAFIYCKLMEPQVTIESPISFLKTYHAKS